MGEYTGRTFWKRRAWGKGGRCGGGPHGCCPRKTRSKPLRAKYPSTIAKKTR